MDELGAEFKVRREKMYTTRPLSFYKNAPEAISTPPEGLNSGFLVLQDEESTPTCCFGLCKSSSINDLPFPQNKLLSVVQTHRTRRGGHTRTHTIHYAVCLIPVINQPLSSNRYYAIKADGRHKGEAYASSKEEEMGTCCFFFPYVQDVKPRPLDPNDTYQQFEFSITKTCANRNMMVARSVAPDGYPPGFLRREGWRMDGQTPRNFTLGEANGLNSSHRARLPDTNFPLSQEFSNSLVVGKWYCPFMFIKEGTEKDQMKRSVFYQMTLEQRWERIFTTQNTYSQASNKAVNIDLVIPSQTIRIQGCEAVQVEKNDGAGFVWLSTVDGKGNEEEVGLSRLIMERIMLEEEKGGWVEGKKKEVRIEKQEEGERTWTSYGCYMLIESFVLRRNDGSSLLTYDFRHAHQLRSKWE